MKLGLTLGLSGQGGSGFNPASLFGASDQGVVYEPNPNNCGVSVGAGVATMTDTSGKGNNAVQTTAGNRPLLWNSGAYYGLDFDGTDDWLQTAAINFTATDQMTVIAGLSKDSDAATSIAVELSTNAGTVNGSFYMAAPEATGASGNYTWQTKGSAAAVTAVASGTVLAANTSVITGLSDISTPVRTIRRNGVQAATSATSMGTGNFGNHALYLGRRAGTTLPFNGRIHALIVINRLLTGDDLTNAEAWVTARTPV